MTTVGLISLIVCPRISCVSTYKMSTVDGETKIQYRITIASLWKGATTAATANKEH